MEPGAAAKKTPMVPLLGLPVTLTVEASSGSVASSAATDETSSDAGSGAGARRATPRRLAWGRQGPEDEEEQEVRGKGAMVAALAQEQGAWETGSPCLRKARHRARSFAMPTG